MKRYVVCAGRLGNQLFHYAFAHFLLEQDKNPQKLRVQLLWSQSGTKSLEFLKSSCSHVNLTKSGVLGLMKFKVVASIIKVLKKFGIYGGILNHFIIQEEQALNYHQGMFLLGYFQKYEYVDKVSGTILPEIFQALDIIQTPSQMLEIEKEKYQVAHIRRGDFLLIENSGFGLLTCDWYLANLKKDLPIVILTDDLKGAASVIECLGSNFVFGPEKADELQALKIMSSATHLVAANSTLSWWGGRLARSKGGSVVYPISATENHRDINFPGFNLQEGIYVKI